ncbi:hypothetical protein V1389_11440 [Flavobacterium rakeshii]|uniref:hypothetical protein n=1 Tax=Flavobacterium rakeshii TaxID=1038845 RepID=UPI002E7B23EC|nr:hypothetical protein [Flavobacterium rakeshii]MEE1898954.1 hypothetical protein [Flavobacterium rakeshii]
MIDRIKKDQLLSSLLEDTCCENGICVTFDGSLDKNNYVIIKVDKFYNSLNIEKRPASIDCLIIRKCISGGYGLTLVELKDIYKGQGFDLDNMKEKFKTTFDDFIKRKFKELLDVEFKEVKLYFVSNIEIYKRDLGLKMELLMNVKFNFNGKSFMIRPEMPHPTIKNCY